MIREYKRLITRYISDVGAYYRAKGYNWDFLEDYKLPVINSVREFCKLKKISEKDYDIIWYRGTIKDIIGRKKAIYIFWKKFKF